MPKLDFPAQEILSVLEQLKTTLISKTQIEDYRDGSFIRASEIMFSQLRAVEAGSKNIISHIIPAIDTAYRTIFDQSATPILTMKEFQAIMKEFKAKNTPSNLRRMQLMGIAFTYLTRKSLPTGTDAASVASFLYGDISDAVAKEDFSLLKEITKKPDSLRGLGYHKTSLFGLGANKFANPERIMVTKSYFSKKSDGSVTTGPTQKESPFNLLANIIDEKNWRLLHSQYTSYINRLLNGKSPNFFMQLENDTISDITKKTFQSGQLGVQAYSAYATKVAVLDYQEYFPAVRNIIAYDPCGGWGDRLYGFLASPVSQIYVNDTNTEMTTVYKKITALAESVNGEDKKKVILSTTPAEELMSDPENQKVAGKVNVIVTSPPYFSRENYHGKQSSHRRYKTYDQWNESFLKLFALQLAALSCEGGLAWITVRTTLSNEKRPGEITCTTIPFGEDTIKAFTEASYQLRQSVSYNSNATTPSGEITYIFQKNALLFREPSAASSSSSISGGSSYQESSEVYYPIAAGNRLSSKTTTDSTSSSCYSSAEAAYTEVKKRKQIAAPTGVSSLQTELIPSAAPAVSNGGAAAQVQPDYSAPKKAEPASKFAKSGSVSKPKKTLTEKEKRTQAEEMKKAKAIKAKNARNEKIRTQQREARTIKEQEIESLGLVPVGKSKRPRPHCSQKNLFHASATSASSTDASVPSLEERGTSSQVALTDSFFQPAPSEVNSIEEAPTKKRSCLKGNVDDSHTRVSTPTETGAFIGAFFQQKELNPSSTNASVPDCSRLGI